MLRQRIIGILSIILGIISYIMPIYGNDASGLILFSLIGIAILTTKEKVVD